jgi:hypothetical protein
VNRRLAFPFLTLSDAAVTATPWQLSLDGSDWIALGDHLPDWDASSTIHVRRSIRVDPDRAARELSSSPNGLRLIIVVQAGTGQGRLPRMILERHRQPLGDGSWVRDLEFAVPGWRLSMVLDLLTEVTLAEPPSSAAPLSPHATGDRLWADRSRLLLEGEEPRFPIETVDLSALLGDMLASSAPWHLHWSPADWERDFHGAVRLYLNEKATGLLERVESQDSATLQAILADVIGQICERFILDPEADAMMTGAEPGSLGAQATAWLRKAWPERDASYIRSVLENRPGVFRSSLLALARMEEA